MSDNARDLRTAAVLLLVSLSVALAPVALCLLIVGPPGL